MARTRAGLGKSLALLVLIGVISALLVVPAALAHGTCGGDANGPYKLGSYNQVQGKVSYICGSQHDRLEVNGCLQKKVGGTWTNKNCASAISGIGYNGTEISVYPYTTCSTGKWRTVFDSGYAYNNAGEMAHQQTANENSPVTTITSC